MSEPDEYDAFYFPLRPEDFDAIEAITARAIERVKGVDIATSHNLPTHPTPPLPPPSPDEFDAYDLSEFTAEDFEQIDKMVLSSNPALPPPVVAPEIRTESPGSSGTGNVPDSRILGKGGGSAHGGPRIQITMEEASNANPSRYLKDARASSRPKRSPYEQFRKWNGLLSVTDLTGPSWCEVQFDYGLRQKRYKKLTDRPASFVTAEGKTITVTQSVAAVNHRTVTRGKSVHKVLEREIQPDEVQVDVATAEERWALRLVNMFTSLHILMEQGRCREIPVFGIVHDQPVTGIIDEIVRISVPSPEPSTQPGATISSPNKRSAPQTAPTTPSRSRLLKKCRQELTTDQQQITSFFTPTTLEDSDSEMASNTELPTTPVQPEIGRPMIDDAPASPRHVQYVLRLSDTKTRIRPSLPSDEDTFASRVQLMLYHRLLATLLSSNHSESSTSTSFDFNELWQRVGVDPDRRFSDKFLVQTGLSASPEKPSTSTKGGSDPEGPSCLNDLTLQWRHTVDALNVTDIDGTLALVYRMQPRKWRPKDKRKEDGAASLSLSDQEARDLAAAVEASLNDVHPDGRYEAELKQAISESLKDAVLSGRVSDGDLGILTHPFGRSISDVPGTSRLDGEYGLGGVWTPEPLSAEPELAWALQQSLLAHIEKTPALQQAIAGAADSAADSPAEAEIAPTAERLPEPSVEPTVATAGEQAVDVPDARQSSSIPVEDEEDDEEAITEAELNTEAEILGTKEFEMDNAFLDEYLTRVLAWWRGERPPEGVNVDLTRRCVTCEYREGCEWRDKKAQEALENYKRSHGTPGSVEVWL